MVRVHRLLVLLAVLAFASLSLAQNYLKPGSPAPALTVDKWIQTPAGFNASNLRGKVVVVEFWATWCTPCVAQIPHLNELADSYKNKDIVFLSITDDSEDRLSEFLPKKPMKSIIGIDTTRKSWATYGVNGIPFTVIIGKDGNVIGTTRPDSLTPAVLDEALAGGNPKLKPIEGIESDLEWDRLIDWQDGIAPLAYAIIKPVVTTTSGDWTQPAHFVGDGIPLQVIVQAAFQVDNLHLDWRTKGDEPKQRYRVAVKVPKDHPERLHPLMQQTVQSYFGLKARWEEQEKEVLVLRRTANAGPLPESKAEVPVYMSLRGKITLKKKPIGALCELLSGSLQKFVVDETGLTKLYDFEFSYLHDQPKVLSDGLTKAGFELVKATRKVRMLVVESSP